MQMICFLGQWEMSIPNFILLTWVWTADLFVKLKEIRLNIIGSQ